MVIKEDNKFIVRKDKVENGNQKQTMPDWSIFDKIYCIHYLPYKERFENIKKELDRVGILNSPNFEFYYTVQNDYYKFLLFKDNDKWQNDITKIKWQYENSPQIGIDLCKLNKSNINLTIDSYNLLKICYYQQYKNVLFIEDDVMFLNDISIISQIINNIPPDYDVVNMDPFIFKQNRSIRINKNFSKYSNMIVYNMSFTALSNRAIQQIIDNQNDTLKPFDTYTWLNAQNLNTYFSNTSVCIQNLKYDVRQNSYLKCNQKYDAVDRKKYNEI